jgi:hypothetical protein
MSLKYQAQIGLVVMGLVLVVKWLKWSCQEMIYQTLKIYFRRIIYYGKKMKKRPNSRNLNSRTMK